jgi:hypothetical protein
VKDRAFVPGAAGVGRVGFVRARLRFGQWWGDRLAAGAIDLPERTGPLEDPRLGLGELPAELVLVPVVAFAAGSEVVLHGWSAVGVVVGVVEV